jgi:two-component system cell cycle response regulator
MNKEHYFSILNNIYDGVYFVNIDRQILFWNKGAERITGYSYDEVSNRYCYDNLLHHVDLDGNQLCLTGCPLHKTIDDGKMRTESIYLKHKKGYQVPVTIRAIQIKEDDEVVGAVEIFSDDTEKFEIIKDNQKLKILAMSDPLTKLPSRRYIETFLSLKLNEHNHFGLAFGLLFIDVDNFKETNDTYGHATGDAVLVHTANALMNSMRRTDMVGRYGGEEFIAILPGIEEDKLEEIAEKVREKVQHDKFLHNGQEITVTVSIGATSAHIKDDIYGIINRADKLMYKSKSNGKNCVSLG